MMKNILGYKQFMYEQVQTEWTDIKGNKLTAPPDTKPQIEKKGDEKQTIITSKQINPKQTIYTGKTTWWEHLSQKGWKPVWKEVLKSQEIKSEMKPLAPKSVVIDLKGNSYFDLGGMELTDDSKKFIQSKLLESKGVDYKIDSYQIESSTDKTRVLPKLKKNLESKRFTGDNQGLSKAREQAIRKYIESLGYGGIFSEPIIKWEQGGVKDPETRYVKVTVNLSQIDKKPEIITSSEGENEIWWFQKLVVTKIPKGIREPQYTPDAVVPGQCPTGIAGAFQSVKDKVGELIDRGKIQKAAKKREMKEKSKKQLGL